VSAATKYLLDDLPIDLEKTQDQLMAH